MGDAPQQKAGGAPALTPDRAPYRTPAATALASSSRMLFPAHEHLGSSARIAPLTPSLQGSERAAQDLHTVHRQLAHQLDSLSSLFHDARLREQRQRYEDKARPMFIFPVALRPPASQLYSPTAAVNSARPVGWRPHTCRSSSWPRF